MQVITGRKKKPFLNAAKASTVGIAEIKIISTQSLWKMQVTAIADLNFVK